MPPSPATWDPHGRLLLIGAALAQMAPRPQQSITRCPLRTAHVTVCLSVDSWRLGAPWVCWHHLFLQEWKGPESRAGSPSPPQPPASGAWGSHTELSPLRSPATPLSATGLPSLNISLLNLHSSFLPSHSQLKICQRLPTAAWTSPPFPPASISVGRGRSQAPELARCVHCRRHTVCIY